MIIKRLDRAVLALQVDPDAEEPRELQVSPRDRVSEGKRRLECLE
jgi:hypothetical protein